MTTLKMEILNRGSEPTPITSCSDRQNLKIAPASGLEPIGQKPVQILLNM